MGEYYSNYEINQMRVMMENSLRRDMETLSFTERVARTEAGQHGLLTREESMQIQNSRSWTSGLNYPRP